MLKVDIRNRILKPKVGEIITVIGDIYTTVAETIPDENGRCESCDFNDKTKVGGDCGDFVSCSKLNRKDNVMFKLIERSYINGDAARNVFLVVANLLIYVGVYGVLMVMGLN